MEKTDVALITLDVQVHMFSPEDPVYQGEHLLEKIGHLQEKAHQTHTPIIYVQQGRPRKGHPLEVRSSGWQLRPILVPGRQDIIIQKQMPSAFYQTTPDKYLSAHAIKKLIIAGRAGMAYIGQGITRLTTM